MSSIFLDSVKDGPNWPQLDLQLVTSRAARASEVYTIRPVPLPYANVLSGPQHLNHHQPFAFSTTRNEIRRYPGLRPLIAAYPNTWWLSSFHEPMLSACSQNKYENKLSSELESSLPLWLERASSSSWFRLELLSSFRQRLSLSDASLRPQRTNSTNPSTNSIHRSERRVLCCGFSELLILFYAWLLNLPIYNVHKSRHSPPHSLTMALPFKSPNSGFLQPCTLPKTPLHLDQGLLTIS